MSTSNENQAAVSEPITLASPVSLPPAATPLTLSTTTLPKVELSHRWTIDNAEAYLTHGTAILQENIVIRSPEFTANGNVKWTKWFLCVKRSTKKPDATVLSLEAKIGDTINTKVLVSGCKFSIVDSSTSEVKYFKMAPLTEFYVVIRETANSSYRGINSTSTSVSKLSHLDIEIPFTSESYFCNGALTIQVDATLLEVSKQNEMVKKACGVPMDSIRSEMHTLFKESALTDVTIKCSNKEFKVHKAVLASQSLVFRKMFETDMIEKKSDVVNLSEHSVPIVSELVTYLYTGAAPNIGCLASDLLDVAGMYEIRRLIGMCENELIMKIKKAVVIDLLMQADRVVDAKDLKIACMEFIKLNLAEIQETEEWKEAKKEHKDIIIETLEYASPSPQS